MKLDTNSIARLSAGLLVLALSTAQLSAQSAGCNCAAKDSTAVFKGLLAQGPSSFYDSQPTAMQAGAQGGLIQGGIEQEGGPLNILILIDASYSMKETLGGGEREPKMTSAKRVLEIALARIPPDVNLGLRVFGQSFSGSPEIDCQQSALLVPIGNGNRRSIVEQVRHLRPYGLTPLTYALMQAERDLRRVQGQKTVILISDGAETCGGDPCEYIARLRALGVNIKIEIVSLGLKREKDARAQLNCIAEKSGGKYYDANTAAELVDSIGRMVSSAISGRVITKSKQPVTNIETTPEVINGSVSQPANNDSPLPMPVPVLPSR